MLLKFLTKKIFLRLHQNFQHKHLFETKVSHFYNFLSCFKKLIKKGPFLTDPIPPAQAPETSPGGPVWGLSELCPGGVQVRDPGARGVQSTCR